MRSRTFDRSTSAADVIAFTPVLSAGSGTGASKEECNDGIGLPDGAVNESRDRVMTALINSGFNFTFGRTIACLAGAENLLSDHISEAVQYRSPDRLCLERFRDWPA